MNSRIRMLGSLAMAGVMAASFAGCTRIYRNVTHKAVSVTHSASNYNRGHIQKHRGDYRWDTSVGDITVSTPVFIAVSWKEKKKPLEFSSFGEMDSIIKNIQQAGTRISDIEFRSRELLASLSAAGTQIDNSDTTNRTSGMSAATALNLAGALQGSGTSPEITDTAQLQQILTEVLSNLKASGEGSAKGTADIGTNFATTSESKRSESFKTPDIPELPTAPTLPEAIEAKMVALLEGTSGLANVVHPAELASLAASLRLHMVDMESYYNPGVWGLPFAVDNGDGDKYLPYKVHFNVSAETGWYTQLQQFDAVAEISFSLEPDDKGAKPVAADDAVKVANTVGLSENLERVNGSAVSSLKESERSVDKDARVKKVYDERAYKVVSVVPFESAQALEELDSSLDSMSLALQAQGSGGGFAGRAAYRQLRAIASRLEGTRTNKTLVVGFPDENKVRIRMRAPVVPNRNGRDLQPRSRMFTATILVKESEAARFDTMLKQAKGSGTSRCLVLSHRYWEPAVRLGEYSDSIPNLYPFAVRRNSKQYNRPFIKRRLFLDDNDGLVKAKLVKSADSMTPRRYAPIPVWPVPPSPEKFDIAGEQGIYGPPTTPVNHYHGVVSMRLKGAEAGDEIEVWGVGATAAPVLARKVLAATDLPSTTLNFHVQKPLDQKQPVTVFLLARFWDQDATPPNYKTRMKVLNLTPVNTPIPAPPAGITLSGSIGDAEVKNVSLNTAQVVSLLTEVLRSSVRINVEAP